MDEEPLTDRDWTQPGATTPPAMPPCPICLGDIDPEAQQQHRPHRWPGCQHPIHLGCLMHFVTRQASPTCPACRQPWSPQAGQHLDQARAAAHLEWPVPETPADTTAPRDRPPNPPTNIIPLCCPRLALINPSHPELDASWRELPTRHMEWAPTMDQTTRQWQAEWICLRCNRQVTTEHPSMQHTGPTPHCSIHGPRQLAIDHGSNERGWVCSTGYPPHFHSCQPTLLQEQGNQEPERPEPANGPWTRQGPPDPHQNLPATHSWFYVPLLLAGARRLHPDAEHQWGQHDQAGNEWINLLQQLREAPPVPWQQVHNTLTTLQHLNASGGRPIPPEEQAIAQRIATAGSQAPHGSHVHLGWAITQVISSSGYIPATAQETLLQTYLGPQFASHAATLATRWRQPHPPRPVAPQHAGPQHNIDGAPNPIEPLEEQRGQQTRQATDPSPSSSPSTDPSPSDSSSTESTSTSSDTGEDHGAARARAPPPPRRALPNTHTEEPTHHHRHQSAFHSLDQVDLQKALEQKYCGFQSPPSFLKGRFRQALTFALEAILQAHTPEQSVRAWKLWMLLPRMLLHRPPGTRTLSKADWRERIAKFQQDEWTLLLRQGGVHTDTDPALRPQDPQNTEVVGAETPHQPTQEQRTRRARQLTHQGELSAARQALTTGPLAPHTQATLQELRDPRRRPQEPYQAFPDAIREFQPAHPPNLPATQLLTNLRRARKGAAPGPSGYTSEVLRLVLDDEGATSQFVAVATRIANAELPPQITQALGLGRIVALQKPNGRVRGIVVGDLFRRLVARCLAQTYAPQIHTACKPHQFALSTRAGTEAIVHALTAATESNPTHTILSVDGIGAYDTISRASMLQGFLTVPEANCCLPFVRQFYTAPSTYIWHDAAGQPHSIVQAEGGEQGDPLMPALFSLGQRAALQTVQAELEPGETIFAFLDDIYCILPPERVRPVYDLLAHHLQAQAHIRLNSGKTRIWNASGQQPPNIETLGPEVWVGSTSQPRHEQGLIVLGAPVGTTEYKQLHLQHLRTEHDKLLQQLPHLQDLQASWLLLLYCASPRCIYQLRMLPPNITAQFSQDHDAAVAACLSELLDAGPIPATSLAIAHLPLNQGGLGLTSASVTATPVHWASWADTPPVLYNQAPQHAETLLHQLQHPTEAPPAVQAAITAANDLQEHGFTVPEWEALATGSPRIPYQLRSKPPTPPRPSQPSPASLPTGAPRQQKLHHNPIQHRHPISHTFVPNPHAQTLAPPHPPHSSSLPVPSHS